MKVIKLFGILVLSITILTGCGGKNSVTSAEEDTAQSDVIAETTVPKTGDQKESQAEGSEEETDDTRTSAVENQGVEKTDNSAQRTEENDETNNSAQGTAEDVQYYSLVTDLPKSEVEAFAKQVRECVVSQDWSRLAAFMCDSVTVDGDTYSVKDFDQMDFSRVNADFISATEAESCQDMFCNWQGIMLGNGEIWISAVTDEDEEKTLCVTAINGLLS